MLQTPMCEFCYYFEQIGDTQQGKCKSSHWQGFKNGGYIDKVYIKLKDSQEIDEIQVNQRFGCVHYAKLIKPFSDSLNEIVGYVEGIKECKLVGVDRYARLVASEYLDAKDRETKESK